VPVAPPDPEPTEEHNARLEAENAELRALVEAQADRIAGLESQLEDLKARLDQDSGNSSAPPSRDRTDRRERRAAERAERKERQRAERANDEARRPGKQPGAPGSTLMRRSPDATVVHSPECCSGCGQGLETASVVGRATRQVLDIPEPRLQATDHVAERRRCGCGADTTADFPLEATGPVCWGPRARANAAYLAARQHLPLERAAEAMADLFAAPMGQGTLAGVLPDAARRLSPFLDRLTELLGTCPVTHADETSIRICAGLGWVHTVSAPGLTLLAYHRRRGIDAMIDIGVLDHYDGTIVHDGFGSYDRPELAAATHAQCGAHLLRHLDRAAEVDSQRRWAAAMRAVLLEAKAASEAAAAAGLGTVPVTTATRIVTRYAQVLDQALAGLPAGPPPRRKHTGGWTHVQREAWNLATRMRRHQDQVLRLLVDTRVPFDNNEAERSLRMAKLHDKISGCFRSVTHAEAFLAVRSYLQTGRKHDRRALDLLVGLWTAPGAWLPAAAVPDTG